MIFSKLGRSSPRSSHSRKLLCRGGGGATTGGTSPSLPLLSGSVDRIIGQSGYLRGYLASIGAGKEFTSKAYLSDLNFVLANPRIRRFFSSEAPKKKNYENFYPKEKKEIPKQNDQKPDSKGDLRFYYVKVAYRSCDFLLFNVYKCSLNLLLYSPHDSLHRTLTFFNFFSTISEDSKTDDQWNFQETFLKLFQNLVTPLLALALFLSMSPWTVEQQQVSDT
ncbi:ATP-dependent zinc metalloprotease FTSH 3, mitochondrial-like [Gossypium australe]|uniref:ATP-dependent zinc metalloprotease FTSH 3, mitochondrial-like n=1 Tax=Gossypium australe TaxID=47621 RepID=A0A5B6X9R0_9ROSI|nr:ATP-dependent zinc metalloprotease FTSH 3, mitochondrial-like [Gossypium australe]